MPAAGTIEALVAALVEEVTERTTARVLAALGATGAPVYCTERRELFPPKCKSARAARDRILAVPEHEDIGRGRARVVRCTAADYAKHYATKTAKRPRLVVPTAPTSDLDDEALASAAFATRFRATKRTA